MRKASTATCSDLMDAGAEWPDRSEQVWKRLSPEGWEDAVIKGAPLLAVLMLIVKAGMVGDVFRATASVW